MPLDNTLIYPVVSTCTADVSKTARHCLPIVAECGDTTPSFAANIGALWNCRIASECLGEPNNKQYHNPIFGSDTIHLQFQFQDIVNSDPTQPQHGWREAPTDTHALLKIEVVDPNGTVLTNNIDEFAPQWVVGWKHGRSYQSVDIDTSQLVKAPFSFTDCFSFKITTYKFQDFALQEDIVIYTEPFTVINNFQCDQTLLIQGVYRIFDSYEFYYGLFDEGAWVGSNNFAHQLKWRIYAGIADGESQVSFTKYNEIAVGNEIQDFTMLELGRAIPDYLKTLLSTRILAAGHVRINGLTDFRVGDYTTENLIRYSEMYLGAFQLYKYFEGRLHC